MNRSQRDARGSRREKDDRSTAARPATLRLHLRDGSSVIVREAVVRADSITGVPWGSAPRGARIAVARTQVERVDVGQTDEIRTTGLLVGIVALALGGFVWSVRSSYTT
jgi:hypothetical protein